MHVVFGTKRHVVVDHNRKFGNVQTSGGHIGCHQHFNFALLESLQSSHTLFLGLVSVNSIGRNANARKRACKTTACDLGVHKDDDLLDRTAVFAVTLEDIDENIGFFGVVNLIDNLLDRIGRGVFTSHFHEHRVAQEVAGKFLHFRRERCREHQVLTLFRQQIQNARNVGQKAHIKHTVGLVENHDFDLREVHRTAFMVVKQTTGRCREDLNATAQHVGLRLDVHAAVDHAHAQRRLACVLHKTFINLHCQFASRRKNQHAHGVTCGRHRRIGLGKNSLQCRQSIAGRLTRTGLCRSHHILPRKHDGDSLHLNRRGRDIAHFGNRCLDM